MTYSFTGYSCGGCNELFTSYEDLMRHCGICQELKGDSCIETIALMQLKEEEFRRKVEARKEWLRRPWWHRIFPWEITITVTRRQYDTGRCKRD